MCTHVHTDHVCDGAAREADDMIKAVLIQPSDQVYLLRTTVT